MKCLRTEASQCVQHVTGVVWKNANLYELSLILAAFFIDMFVLKIYESLARKYPKRLFKRRQNLRDGRGLGNVPSKVTGILCVSDANSQKVPRCSWQSFTGILGKLSSWLIN